MSADPQVSAIIIFLNAEQFIQEAIGSVLDQTYEDWELLLVDDGSTDGSTRIAQDYARRYPGKICYLEHEGHRNRGMSASRNLGIAHARGDMIAFLDSDDIWLADKLKEQVEILESHPQASMVYGLSLWWYSWSGDDRPLEMDKLHALGVPANTIIQPPGLLAPFFLSQEAAIPCPSDILVRKAAVQRVGGFEEKMRTSYEDQAFYAKICLSEPVYAADRCWDKYRQHSNSSVAVAEKKGEVYQNRLFFLKWLSGYLAMQEGHDPDFNRALRRQIRLLNVPILYRLDQAERRFRNRWRGAGVAVARKTIPAPLRERLAARWNRRAVFPPVGKVHLGSLRRVTPLSRDWGYERGLPVDRYYIDQFLSRHAADIRGTVLEIGDDVYSRRFGNGSVTKREVLFATAGDPKATIIADLSQADHIPSDTFDCIVFTQTLQFIYDVRAVLKTLYRILKPSGVVLATTSGVSPISRYDMDRWGHYWSFTSLSLKRLFEEAFPAENVEIEAYGNVLTAAAFLYGLAAEELCQKELDYRDVDYEVLLAIRAVKPVD